MIKIMFVCHGNICRSPMAEFVMKNIVKQRNAEDKISVFSAATSNEEIGNGIHYGTRKKLREEGIPFTEHFAVRITKGDYDKYDYIIGMDDNNIRNMLRIFGGDSDNKISLLLSHAGLGRSVADPWYTGDFDKTYSDVKFGCEALADKLII